MSETVTIAPRERAACDLVYDERASRERSLHLVLQDLSARTDGGRRSFLAAAYRDAVARYQSSARIEGALAFLRRTVRTLDDFSIQVETRVDDFQELAVCAVVEEADAFFVLCTRDTPARVRCDGAFVAIDSEVARARVSAVAIPIETTRSQHDLFAQTLPDALGLYRIPRPAPGATLEFLIGGAPSDLGAALDALDTRRGGATVVASDRASRTLRYLRFDGRTRARTAGAERDVSTRARATWVRGAVAMALVGVVVAAAALVVTRVDVAREPRSDGAQSSREARATQSRPTPVDTRSTPPEEHADVDADSQAPAPASDERFDLAWEHEYTEPVTSSPSLLGDGVVFGSRDGRVYALDRSDGEAMWSHQAVGGVGASPLVVGGAVVVADYGGNVYRLARDDGRVLWKRALKERIVSTPASTNERLAVGTTKGNVYALSLETGRVLWRFAARGAIRGGIEHAGGSFLVPSNDGRLYAIADDTGRKRWSVALGGPVASTPCADETRVVVGTPSGALVAHALADGKRLWSFATRGAVNSAVLIHDGRVYAGSSDNRVYCIDAQTGDAVWNFATSGSVLARPVVDGNRVLVASYDGSVYALDAKDGALVDRYDTDKSIFSSPVVDGDRVYFGNNAGRFICLNLPSS